MSDGVSRDEYNRGQERIHIKVDEIKDSVARQEVACSIIKEQVSTMRDNSNKVYTAVYGNGKDGLGNKYRSLNAKVGFHFWLICFAFTTGATFIFLMMRVLVKK